MRMSQILSALALSIAVFNTVQARTIGDFTLDEKALLIPINEIHSGGPPKDGIPAIDKPKFIQSSEALVQKLSDNSRIMGLSHNGVAKAYPVSIMNWHEIVNDRFGDEVVVITYCPLCGSGVAFDANVNGEALDFGVSGLLYNSDVLLYDRKTESLWSQIMSQAVSGEMKGHKLKMLPLLQTSWGEWKQLYPDTLVLSRDTGSWRNYDRDPYDGYEDSTGVYFPVKSRDPRYHPKERVLGLEVDGKFKAYPFAELSKTQGKVSDKLAGQNLMVEYNDTANSARIFDAEGKEIPAINSFWFAWYAFHPDTEVFEAE